MLRIIITFIFVVVCALWLFTGTGCTSSPKIDGRAIVEYQHQIDKLEAELDNRDRTIELAVRELEVISGRSKSMEGTIDEVIQLFAEYSGRVDKLLHDYSTIRTEAEKKKQATYADCASDDNVPSDTDFRETNQQQIK